MFDVHLVLAPGCLDAYPNLKDFHKRFAELEKVKNFLASDRCIKKKINFVNASFASGK